MKKPMAGDYPSNQSILINNMNNSLNDIRITSKNCNDSFKLSLRYSEDNVQIFNIG